MKRGEDNEMARRSEDNDYTKSDQLCGRGKNMSHKQDDDAPKSFTFC